jgi:hypothetical protein
MLPSTLIASKVASSVSSNVTIFFAEIFSAEAALTSVGGVMEARGRELIGDEYNDPITSFSDVHKFSNENPEVMIKDTAFLNCFVSC